MAAWASVFQTETSREELQVKRVLKFQILKYLMLMPIIWPARTLHC